MSQRALVDQLRALPEEHLASILASLTNRQRAALAHAWLFWARPDQLPPDDIRWVYWLCLGGRASGKTRTGAEWCISEARKWGPQARFLLLAATEADIRQTLVEGPSGILACSPPDFIPTWTRSVGGGELQWPNGAKALCFGVEVPGRLRGKQCNRLWCDDVAAWGPTGKEAWAMAAYGFRMRGCGGVKCVLTSSPDGEALLRGLVKSQRKGLVVTRSVTDDNRNNLADGFFEQAISEFAGTALERVERYGEDPDENAGALWKRSWIHEVPVAPEFTKVVVSVDPALTEEAWSDETGIVVLGLDDRDCAYVLADHTGKHTADRWPEIVNELFRDYQADYVVLETNAGRNLVKRNLLVANKNLPIRYVDAKRGKTTRADPIAQLYKAKRVFHVAGAPGVSSPLHRDSRGGRPATLEAELVTWVPRKGRSPNGIDALVWGVWHLIPVDAWSSTEATAPTADRSPDPLRYSSREGAANKYASPAAASTAETSYDYGGQCA